MARSDLNAHSFSVIVTLFGPGKFVTISECHNSQLSYSIKLLFWTSMVDNNCHNKQFVAISGITITEKDCNEIVAHNENDKCSEQFLLVSTLDNMCSC